MRINYSKVAELASAIYFSILQLASLDPMYQFSLEFYVRVFKKAIKQAEKGSGKNKIRERVSNIMESLKRCVYF